MKTLLIILLLAVTGASIAFNIIQLRKSREADARMSTLGNSSNGHSIIVDRYIHDSIEHVVTREVLVNNDAEKPVAVGGGYLDTLTSALQIAVKQVDEVQKVNAQLVAANLQLRQGKAANLQQYDDKYLQFVYNSDSNRMMSLHYDVALNHARYWKRSWLLGPKQYFNDYFSDDSRVSIMSVKRYRQAEVRQKRFGIGFNAGYAYIPARNSFSPFLGLGLNYNIIEF